MNRRLAIALCLLLSAEVARIARAAPVSYGAGPSDAGDAEASRPLPYFSGDAGVNNTFSPPRPLPDDEPLLHYDDKTLTGRHDSPVKDSRVLGDPDEGIPRIAPADLKPNDDAAQQADGFRIPAGSVAPLPSIVTARSAGASHLVDRSSLDLAPSGSNAAVWETAAGAAPEEYGFIDRPEFAGALALVSGVLALFLVTRVRRRRVRRPSIRDGDVEYETDDFD